MYIDHDYLPLMDLVVIDSIAACCSGSSSIADDIVEYRLSQQNRDLWPFQYFRRSKRNDTSRSAWSRTGTKSGGESNLTMISRISKSIAAVNSYKGMAKVEAKETPESTKALIGVNYVYTRTHVYFHVVIDRI